MKDALNKRAPSKKIFDRVKRVGVTLPGVEAATKYDGSTVLRAAGIFVAGVATHRSAEPGTIVVRAGIEERERLMEDAPETYYLTEYYRPYPLILVRVAHVDRDALHDLLAVSRRMALAKRSRGAPRHRRDVEYGD